MYFLWPDHNIGKRESRRIREEHNATVNQLLAERDELLRVLKRVVAESDGGWLSQSETASQAIAIINKCKATA